MSVQEGWVRVVPVVNPDGTHRHRHVTDGTGAPVEAEVRVSGFTLSEGERRASRPADGRFERLLPGPGVYTVKASAPGKGVAEATIRVDGRATVALVLRAP